MTYQTKNEAGLRHQIFGAGAKFVFFGTPEFAVKILESLKKADFIPLLIITAPDSPSNRGLKLNPPPVKIWALKNEIPFFQPQSKKELVLLAEKIKNKNPEFFLIAAYGFIIPKNLIDIPQKGSLNVHPSLLPKYRGPSPIQTAILNGEKKTGVSIILMDEKVDHGPILSQKEIVIGAKETYAGLNEKLAELGGSSLITAIPRWLDGKINPKKQDHSKSTYTKILKREDGRINWNQEASRIERMIRAFQPWPGAFSFFEKNGVKKRIYFLQATSAAKNPNKNPGESFPYNGSFAIQARNSALAIERLKLEGKKETAAKDFVNGHPYIKNTKFF